MGPGQLVRAHRRRRGWSQLALAAAAGVSARHLSFIETGRSRPGRAVLAALGRALDLPAREVNGLLRAAGERPPYPEHDPDDAAVRPLRDALERMLAAHMPLPAVAMDHAWHPVSTNPAFDAMMRRLAARTATPPGDRGLMEWLFAPDGLRPLVANWGVVGPFLLDRVRRESVVHGDLDRLVERLEAMLGRVEESPSDPDTDAVVLPLHLVVDGRDLRLFSVLAAFGSALDAGFQALRIEYFFPKDEATRTWLRVGAGG